MDSFMQVRLSVEVPATVCDDCYRRVLKELMKRSKVPGFRPGKNVLEDILIGYVGKEIVKKDVVESILERTLPHAMSSVSGRAFEDSIRISTKFPEMENTYSSLKSLRYDVIVDVAPELKWIPEDGYKNLKIVVDIDKEIDVATAAEQELKRRLKALGALRIVTDRGLETGALLLDGNTLSYFGKSIHINLVLAVIAEVALVGGAEYYIIINGLIMTHSRDASNENMIRVDRLH